jgi:hypothetical protein
MNYSKYLYNLIAWMMNSEPEPKEEKAPDMMLMKLENIFETRTVQL